ncbi:MAG: hypothetical protein JXB32_08065 [Deltaproteobacteria bacterium]|nr:hypothetical protein [Deltaproteobacteria bacterium]
MRSAWWLGWLWLASAACGDDDTTVADDGGTDADDGGTDAVDADGDVPFPTTFWSCPGDPGCPEETATSFEAGVGVQVANPTITEPMTVDVDGDGEYEPRDGDEYQDTNGNGRFDGVWIAGFGNPRPANDIHDDIEVRVLALRSGETLLAIVTADIVGIFLDDVETLRASVADLGIDFLLVAASHNHEGPDTIGIWGLDEVTCGADPVYMDFLLAQMEAATREAVADLRPARVRYGRAEAGEHPTKGVANVASDSRDPVIMDPNITVLGFQDAADGSTIATLVHFTSHPEYSSDEINSITADYVHSLRVGVEEGITEGTVDLPGVGGVTVFVQGPLGGQIGPGRVECTGLDGVDVPHDVLRSIEGAQTVGRILAVGALRALADATAPEDTLDLQWVRARFDLTIENYAYHAMFLNHTFRDREIHGYDPTYPLETGNFPHLWSELSWIRLGRAQALTFGGEPFPELFLGGYDGSHTPDAWPLVAPDQPHPPTLETAPAPPYLFDRLEGADYPMAWGLTNDMLGYMVPAYDYFVDELQPYVEDAFGDHYEETNSIGPNGWPTIERTVLEALERRP